MQTAKIISFIFQIILWILFISVPFFGNHPHPEINATFIFSYTIQHLIYIILFYFNYYCLIPHVLYKKNLNSYIAYIALSALATFFVIHTFKFFFLKHYSFVQHYSEPIVPIIQVVAVSVAFKLLIDQIENTINKKILLEEKTKAELNYLRLQINPHFLFNTLNNITALIHINPDKAEQSVIKLSKIMRAMLSNNTQNKIELSAEMDLINSYIDLQKIRLNEDTKLNFKIIGETQHLLIEPLILINFIENVFKHGIGEGKNEIEIAINVNENRLNLITQNKKAFGKKDETTGIGLSNVTKRLEIVYKDKYTLTINSTNQLYIVNLTLELV